MKIGIIRPQMTEDYCPGTADFRVVAASGGAFAGLENSEIVGFTSCGGCRGKKMVLREGMLLECGADAIALASCMTKGNPIGYPCPHAEKLLSLVKKECEGRAKVLEYTH